MKIIFRNLAVIFLLIVITIPFANLTAQKSKIEFEHYSTEQGLSQNSIMRNLQDSRGFLWTCTFNGFYRYDGYQFKIYRNIPGDSIILSNNKILSMCEDKTGNIWIGTYGRGLNKLLMQNNFVEQILLSSEYNNIRAEECYNIKKIIYQLTYLQKTINEL